MISEKDKQQILNGEFAINRDELKCKYIGLSYSTLFPYMFASLGEEDRIITCYHVTRAFTFCTDGQQRYDIVGLWKNKVPPFNLDKALEGHPVKLRNGCKAYVKYTMPEDYTGTYPVRGYYPFESSLGGFVNAEWTLEGKAYSHEGEVEFDIIGMWEEDKPETDKEG